MFKGVWFVKEGSHKLCTCVTATEQHSLYICLQVFYFHLPDMCQSSSVLKRHVVLVGVNSVEVLQCVFCCILDLLLIQMQILKWKVMVLYE